MSDFRRLAAAFDVLVRDLEIKLAALTVQVSAQQADLLQLRDFLDHPSMIATPGYNEGLHRSVRMEVEIQRLEAELGRLRAAHGQAQGKRDRCLDRARETEGRLERHHQELGLLELLSQGADASLTQSGSG